MEQNNVQTVSKTATTITAVAVMTTIVLTTIGAMTAMEWAMDKGFKIYDNIKKNKESKKELEKLVKDIE